MQCGTHLLAVGANGPVLLSIVCTWVLWLRQWETAFVVSSHKKLYSEACNLVRNYEGQYDSVHTHSMSLSWVWRTLLQCTRQEKFRCYSNCLMLKLKGYQIQRRPKIYFLRNIFCTKSDILLTVHRSIILVTDQLNAQILVYNRFIICLYTFRALLCSSSGGQIVLYSIWYHHACRWSSRCTGWERTRSTCATDGHLQAWWYQMLYNTILTSWWWA